VKEALANVRGLSFAIDPFAVDMVVGLLHSSAVAPTEVSLG
jgi:hypothetical protein